MGRDLKVEIGDFKGGRQSRDEAKGQRGARGAGARPGIFEAGKWEAI